MANNTIDEVIQTEVKAQEVIADFQEQRERLKEDKQKDLKTLEQESVERLNSYEEARRDEAQKAFDAFKSEKDAEQDEQLTAMKNQFSSKEEKLVSYVVGEVKTLYGNR